MHLKITILYTVIFTKLQMVEQNRKQKINILGRNSEPSNNYLDIIIIQNSLFF